MTRDYGEQIRRSSQQATDMLLDEHADIEATAPQDTAANPDPGVQSPDASASSARELDARIAPPGALPPPPAALPPPPALPPTLAAAPPPPAALPPPPPPPAATGPRDGNESRDRGRLGVVVPILLATLGLVAAVIAWRAGVAGSAADDANRAGLDASRERAASVIINEGLTARATEAYLDYERSRRRAEALAAAGANDQAQLNRMQAAGHWFLVRPEYLDRTGQYQPNQQRAALLTDDEQQKDIQPLAHFSTADTQYARLQGLIGAGIVVAFALPFLTLAEIGRGRMRIVSVLAGVAIFLGGAAMAVTAWL
jgi:hypothetical protein